MPTLLMLRGLPASGKTTYALSLPAWQWMRVNQDDIRKTLGWTSWATWDFKSPREHSVYAIKEAQIVNALRRGCNVVSDDTNFGPRETEMRQLAKECGADFQIKEFHTSVDQCIKFDENRPPHAQVGADVIRGMALRHNWPPKRTVMADEHLMPAIVCDLDGTLALHTSGRSPYDTARCGEDTVNRPIKRLIEMYYRFMQYQIIYMTGREEKFRAETDAWMQQFHCPPGPLWMRPTGDFRKDYVVKSELFDSHVRDRYNVEFVLDDRNQVVDFWRSIGLTCLQVAKGDF